jgi:hypothetical protein
MRYDPIKKVWLGNEFEMEAFDKMVSMKRSTPNFIPHNSNLETQIGEMKFDPINLCWIGNENSIDFKSFDEIDEFICEKGKKMFNLEFQQSGLEKWVMDKLFEMEVQHKLLMGRWYPSANQNRRLVYNSRSSLYDIRRL